MIMKAASSLNNNTIIIEYLKDGSHQVHLFDLPAEKSDKIQLKFKTEIKLPEPGAISDLTARQN